MLRRDVEGARGSSAHRTSVSWFRDAEVHLGASRRILAWGDRHAWERGPRRARRGRARASRGTPTGSAPAKKAPHTPIPAVKRLGASEEPEACRLARRPAGHSGALGTRLLRADGHGTSGASRRRDFRVAAALRLDRGARPGAERLVGRGRRSRARVAPAVTPGGPLAWRRGSHRDAAVEGSADVRSGRQLRHTDGASGRQRAAGGDRAPGGAAGIATARQGRRDRDASRPSPRRRSWTAPTGA